MPKNRVRFFHQGRTMSSINSISPDKLARLIGVPHCPALIDVRANEDHEADPRFLPSALRRRAESVAEWASEFIGRPAIVIDKTGRQGSEGVAAWLRHAGAVEPTGDGKAAISGDFAFSFRAAPPYMWCSSGGESACRYSRTCSKWRALRGLLSL
ncbi:MAG TPA: hypothetical protein VIF34_01660 [Methylocystis sp.]|jgi:rhodanese-related sulfurtransferase